MFLGVLEACLKKRLSFPKTESNRKYLKKRGIEVTAKNEIDILVAQEVLGEKYKPAKTVR